VYFSYSSSITILLPDSFNRINSFVFYAKFETKNYKELAYMSSINLITPNFNHFIAS